VWKANDDSLERSAGAAEGEGKQVEIENMMALGAV